MFAGDHFSQQAGDYAAFRPTYPDALGAWLATMAPAQAHVWDCATGSGQAATMLARHFERVTATDASAAQLAHAVAASGVTYREARADASGLPDASCDVVTVAQAAHWFDLPTFYVEARRVLKPGGVIAVWSYALFHSNHAGIDDVVRQFQRERLAPYWPPGREFVDDEYRSLPFPFTVMAAPAFEMTATWTRAQLLGYITSWSAVLRCREAEGRDPMSEITEALKELWRDDAQVRELRWPLHIKASRVATS